MKENLFETNKIRTFTGKYIDPFNPKVEDICIEDIAHALSMIPRFGGHLPVFYSVAEHSMKVLDKLIFQPVHIQLEGLLHDASEAYLLDIPSPIKARIPQYKEAEIRLMNVIFDAIYKDFGKYHLIFPRFGIKDIDYQVLKWEWENIMIAENPVKTMTQKKAKNEFLKLFYSLYNKLES